MRALLIIACLAMAGCASNRREASATQVREVRSGVEDGRRVEVVIERVERTVSEEEQRQTIDAQAVAAAAKQAAGAVAAEVIGKLPGAEAVRSLVDGGMATLRADLAQRTDALAKDLGRTIPDAGSIRAMVDGSTAAMRDELARRTEAMAKDMGQRITDAAPKRKEVALGMTSDELVAAAVPLGAAAWGGERVLANRRRKQEQGQGKKA